MTRERKAVCASSRSQRKRMERIRRSRMQRSVIGILLSVAITVGTMLLLSGFTGAKVPRVSPSGYYHMITVRSNDTLWDIARSACADDGRDIREIIWDILRVNGMSSPKIYPGQKLAVPYQP